MQEFIIAVAYFAGKFETLTSLQSDNSYHSFAAIKDEPFGPLEDKSERRGSEPVLERSERKDLRPPDLVTVFMIAYEGTVTRRRTSFHSRFLLCFGVFSLNSERTL